MLNRLSFCLSVLPVHASDLHRSTKKGVWCGVTRAHRKGHTSPCTLSVAGPSHRQAVSGCAGPHRPCVVCRCQPAALPTPVDSRDARAADLDTTNGCVREGNEAGRGEGHEHRECIFMWMVLQSVSISGGISMSMSTRCGQVTRCAPRLMHCTAMLPCHRVLCSCLLQSRPLMC